MCVSNLVVKIVVSLRVLTILTDWLLLCTHLVGICILISNKKLILRWHWVVSHGLCANVLNGHRIGTLILNVHVSLFAHLVSILTGLHEVLVLH